MLQSLDGSLTKKRIPVFIGLKDWSDSNLSLLDFIIKQFDICNFPKAEPFVKEVLIRGKGLILLDGLDEVSRNVDDVIIQIRDFVDKYKDNQVVLSCRIAGYNYCFEKFTDIEIADFTDKQIETFVKNWFGKGTPKARSCWNKIRDDTSIRELASIPLLLTMLCLAFDETMDFPSNRSELYKEALDALLKKWDASRSIKRDEIYRHLSPRRKEGLLSRIAALTFEKDQYFFPQRFVEKQIGDYIQNLPEAKQESLEPDSEAILKAIEAQHGLFVERANKIYSFSHLTLQEYFTARYIVDNAAKGILKKSIEKHLFDPRWREVFLLTAGMLDEADDFFLIMEEQVEKLKEDKVVQLLLSEVQRIIKILGSTYSTPMIRALALSSTINHIYVRGFSNDIREKFTTTRSIANTIPSSIASDSRFALKHDEAFFAAFAQARNLAGTSPAYRIQLSLDSAPPLIIKI